MRVALLLLLPLSLQAATFTVAPGGSDANPGTAASPWATFAHAAEVAQPGDTVVFRGGTYASGEVELTRSGSVSAPITFIAAAGEVPVLDGRGTAGGLIALKPGVSYLRISGFTIKSFRIWGMTLDGGNRFVTLDHLDIGGGEAAIHFTDGYSGQPPTYGPVEDIVLEDSNLHDPSSTVVDCTPGPCNRMTFRRLEISGGGLGSGPSFGADGLGLEQGYPVLVEDCFVHDNGGDGVDLNSRDRSGNVSGVVVSRNRVVRNRLQGIKLWAGGRMENNVVWGQGINPVMLGVFPGTYEVVNNTIAFNMWDSSFAARDYAFVAGGAEGGPAPSISLTLVNNVFAFNTGPEVGSPTGLYLGPGVRLTESHNLYFSRDDGEIQADFVTGRDVWFTRAEIAGGAWTAATGQGVGDVTADPLFASAPPSADLHLRSGSPAVDAGTSSGAPATDLENLSRDSKPDLGAFELRASAGYSYTVPAVAHSPGAFGSLWRSDVAAVNRSGSSANLTFTFSPAGGGAPSTGGATVPGRGTREWNDVLASLFGYGASDAVSGCLRVDSDQALVLSSRTFNQGTGGTYGAYLPAKAPGEELASGRTGVLAHLKKSGAYRTNVGVTNLGTTEVTVEIRLFDSRGAQAGNVRSLTVPVGGLLQETDVFATSGAGNQEIAFATVEVRTPGGKVWAFASVIDNATGDPTIVPLLIP